MTSEKNRADCLGTLPQSVRRSFNKIGYDEAMRRAREIVPILRERAQRAEDARMLIRENEQVLHETGLFRILQPKIRRAKRSRSFGHATGRRACTRATHSSGTCAMY
jgi:hypothetical protein